MGPIPDITDAGKMIIRGQRSTITKARNEACEALRDACVRVQSASLDEARIHTAKAIEACLRIDALSDLWASIK
jgi:hypothetical protein